jgi:predicted RNase H-like HicB family nuclease
MAIGTRQVVRPVRRAARACLKAGVRYDERTKLYVGYAPALNIYSQATTVEHAKRALESAIALFLAASSNGQRFAAILATAGLTRDHRKYGVDREHDRRHTVEEEILEQQDFQCVFDVPTSFGRGEKAA